jgi:hypothetical protein
MGMGRSLAIAFMVVVIMIMIVRMGVIFPMGMAVRLFAVNFHVAMTATACRTHI